MAIFTPARRWQPPFTKFGAEKPSERVLPFVERWVKGPLFGCRMCGNCLLQETAFICPMECPKGLRNGPCGGSTEECYVDPPRRCVWNAIYDRAFAMGREELLMEVLPPVDWGTVGGETWGDVAKQVKKVGVGNWVSNLRNKEERWDAWQEVFEPVRQPDWWKGDSEYHPPAYTEPASELERRLKAGEFVVTGEIEAPLGNKMAPFHERLAKLKPLIVAANYTDGASAAARMSSIAASKISLEHGVEPVLQIAARDCTRVGLQAQVVGAAAMGIRNMFAITGDSARVGRNPQARLDWVDLDAVQMLWVMRRLRDEGIFLGGQKCPEPPQFFLGAAASPFASQPRVQALREHKKVNAGAQFLQTQLIFDLDGFDRWLEACDKRGFLDKVYVLAGIGCIRSIKAAQYMNDKVPGVVIPPKIMDRLERAGDGIAEVGYQIALETIEHMKNRSGIHGIHFMPLGWYDAVPRLMADANLGPVAELSAAEVPSMGVDHAQPQATRSSEHE